MAMLNNKMVYITNSWKIIKSNIPNPLDSGDQFPPDKSLAKP